MLIRLSHWLRRNRDNWAKALKLLAQLTPFLRLAYDIWRASR